MGAFLEELLPVDVRLGATYADEYGVDITTTRAGAEYRRLVSPYPVRHFTVDYTLQAADLWARVLALYARAYGTYAGFRVACKDDCSTAADHVGSPSPTDQPLALVSAGVYQLQKQYGVGGTALAIGLPVRTLFKPVAGSVRVAVSGVEIAASGWSVDTTTGRVTFAANKTATITAITKAAQAVVSCSGHTFLVGESVHIAGVAGMTQINGKRATIASVVAGTSITLALNTSAYSTYTSGGTANTRPQTGEAVTAGCLFDIPARFNSRIDVSHVAYAVRQAGSIDIIELLNP